MTTRHRITTLALTIVSLAIAISITAFGSARVSANSAAKQEAQLARARVARGQYLVTVGGCNDCHTPLKMGANGPEPDMSRMLSGHPEEVKISAAPKHGDPAWMWSGNGTNTAFAGPWGISYARNLTPDRMTGIGIWDEAMFIKTIRTGRHWGVSRPILPPMPWFNYAKMTDEDLKSVYAYLRTIKPVHNQVPDAVLAPPPPARPGA
ncbi:MAG: c-type cytochrome [Acidobacteria bacterium]|nr:c-type cytochrome [Acidobacteriota bacterium]MBV9476624.1 c-type cytochrome [Acidobacteriota bacterium]